MAMKRSPQLCGSEVFENKALRKIHGPKREEKIKQFKLTNSDELGEL
jgi:hypothetical protein